LYFEAIITASQTTRHFNSDNLDFSYVVSTHLSWEDTVENIDRWMILVQKVMIFHTIKVIKISHQSKKFGDTCFGPLVAIVAIPALILI
jgi:hypothetical protein